MKSLSVPEQHQKSVALKTLKMPDAMVGVMGGMDKDEARKFLKSIGYTDAQVRKLEASQTSGRAAIASELLKVARELTASDPVVEVKIEMSGAHGGYGVTVILADGKGDFVHKGFSARNIQEACDKLLDLERKSRT